MYITVDYFYNVYTDERKGIKLKHFIIGTVTDRQTDGRNTFILPNSMTLAKIKNYCCREGHPMSVEVFTK